MNRRAAALALLFLLPFYAGAQAQAQDAAVPQPLRDPPGFAGTDAWLDVTYAQAGKHALKLDLYVPRNAPRPVPLVVYIHGGGWGGLDRHEGFANGLPAQGFALACVDYRLSGEAPFPAQIEDCKAAVRWLRAHGAGYGCGTEKIGALGDSAGGHLVALLGVTPDDPELEGTGGTPGVSSRVQAVADYFGPSDMLTLIPPGTAAFRGTDNPVAGLLGGSVEAKQAKARLASPALRVTDQACPFLIAHGDADQLVPLAQSVELDDALKKAGVPSQLIVMPGAGHGANSPQAFDAAVALFDKYLR